jgi:hypothetical protein
MENGPLLDSIPSTSTVPNPISEVNQQDHATAKRVQEGDLSIVQEVIQNADQREQKETLGGILCRTSPDGKAETIVLNPSSSTSQALMEPNHLIQAIASKFDLLLDTTASLQQIVATSHKTLDSRLQEMEIRLQDKVKTMEDSLKAMEIKLESSSSPKDTPSSAVTPMSSSVENRKRPSPIEIQIPPSTPTISEYSETMDFATDQDRLIEKESATREDSEFLKGAPGERIANDFRTVIEQHFRGNAKNGWTVKKACLMIFTVFIHQEETDEFYDMGSYQGLIPMGLTPSTWNNMSHFKNYIQGCMRSEIRLDPDRSRKTCNDCTLSEAYLWYFRFNNWCEEQGIGRPLILQEQSLRLRFSDTDPSKKEKKYYSPRISKKEKKDYPSGKRLRVK